MDKYERRRQALLRLKAKLGWGAVARIAAAIGKEPNYVSRMLYPEGKPGRKRIGEESVELLNEKFPSWLNDAMESDANGREGFSRAAKDVLHSVTIARYDTGGRMGAAGVVLKDQPGVIESWRVSREWLEKNVRGFQAAEKLCIVTGFGDSMRPMFNPGDPLIVDSGVTSVEFDAVYFFRVGDEGFIKRLQRVPGKGLLAISENNAYRDWVIDGSMDFEVFGRVLKVWRSEDF